MKIIYTIFFLSVCLIMGSCQENLSDEEVIPAKKALELCSLVANNSLLIRQPYMESQLPSGTQMGVAIYTYNDGDFYPYPASHGISSDNQLWISEGTGDSQIWRYHPQNNGPESFFLSQQSGVLYAWVPYNEEYLIAGQGGKSASLIVESGNVDYLFGRAQQSVNAYNPTVSVVLRHVMSLVSFTFTHDKSYQGDCIIEKVDICGIIDRAALCFDSGQFSPIGESEYSKIKLPVYYYSEERGYELPASQNPMLSFKDRPFYGAPVIENGIRKTPGSFHAFVIPQTEKSSPDTGFMLEMKIDGILYRVNLPNTGILENGKSGVNWDGGKTYTYSIRLNGNKVITVSELNANLSDYVPGGNPEFDFSGNYY